MESDTQGIPLVTPNTDTKTMIRLKLQEHDDRFKEGNGRFKSIEDGISENTKVTKEIHKRLFIDNGTKSFQSKMATQGTLLKIGWAWLTALSIGITAFAFKSIQQPEAPKAPLINTNVATNP